MSSLSRTQRRRQAHDRQHRSRARAERLVDELLAQTQGGLRMARTLHPEIDFSARVYKCERCGTLNAAIAPRDELVDDYGCPECGAVSEPWTECAP